MNVFKDVDVDTICYWTLLGMVVNLRYKQDNEDTVRQCKEWRRADEGGSRFSLSRRKCPSCSSALLPPRPPSKPLLRRPRRRFASLLHLGQFTNPRHHTTMSPPNSSNPKPTGKSP
nr:hypothetical protein Iba_chr05aCG6200 [Ipomoea batatas]